MLLKTEVAKALQAGKLEIPFVTTDLNLEGERTVRDSNTSPKETIEPTPKKQSKTVKATPVTSVSTAIGKNDIGELLKILKVETNPEDLRSGLDYLLQKEKLTEVGDLIKHHQYKNVR